MPPKKASQIHLVVERNAEGAIAEVRAAYSTSAAADDALKEFEDNDAEFEVLAVDLKEATSKPAKKAAAVPTRAKAAPKKKAKAEDEDEDDQDDADENEAEQREVTRKKNAAPEKRKQTVGDGTGALAGLMLLFTGTFEMDRKTCEASARENGATIVSVLSKADYIVLGTKPGPKKVAEIEENGYKTWTEQEFLEKASGKKKKT